MRKMKDRSRGGRAESRQGFVLLTVLIVIAFLALAAYRYTDLMNSEYMASHGAQRSAETRALAESGLHYAMAVLSTGEGTLEQNSTQSVEVDPAQKSPLKGSFQILEIEEESAKLNLNALSDMDSSGAILRQVLQKAQGLVPELNDSVISSIIDWMDEDDDLEDQGAENEYYLSLEQPYRCKNGPIDSMNELLLVKGVTPSLLNGSESSPGLNTLFTVSTREVNFDPQGSTIVRLNDSDLATFENNLSGVLGQPNLTQYIMAYRLYGKSSGSSSGGGSGGGSAMASGGSTSGSGSSGGGGSSSGGSSSGGGSSGGGGSMSSGGGTSGGGGSSSPRSGSPSSPSSGGLSGGGFRASSPTPSAPTQGGASSVSVTPGGAVVVTATAGGGGAQGGSTNQASTVVDTAKLQAQIDQDKQPNFFRQLNKINSIFDLANKDIQVSYQDGNTKKTGTLPSPLKDETVANQYLPILFGSTSTAPTPDSPDKVELPARLNVMSATAPVLSLLPGLQEQDVQNILTFRPQPGDSTGDNLAWLMTKARIPASTLSRVEQYLTTRPKMVRVVSVGKLDGFGVTTVLEGMIDLSGPRPRLAAVRDLSDAYRTANSTKEAK